MTGPPASRRFGTRAVHAGGDITPGTGDVTPPVHLTSTFDRRAQEDPRYFYSRGENPTTEAVEAAIAQLEGARSAVAFSSGQAAGMAALSLVPPDGRVVASDDVYGGTHSLFRLFGRYGVEVVRADLSDPATAREVLARPADLVWLETPTNPLLKITDIAAVAERAHAGGARVLVDNTLVGPSVQQPLHHGADLVLHSTTKVISGHLDVLGGALVTEDESVLDALRQYRTTAGNVPGAWDSFLVHRGLRTLEVRAERQAANARAMAEALRARPEVERVRYPDPADAAPGSPLRRQMSSGGGVVTFEHRGDTAVLLERVELFACAVSLGGVRSLIECPAWMSHRPAPRAALAELGITERMVRLSAGIEDPADLVADLVAALRGD
ncbi:trans-sulfuration enzyme family protein [Saccharopolyspora sp. CA-218241]|uniref:trans-sulfuration enzyme family protein n=1 Tax=Saccharopolyspora sp. CA-218241 TaxID=3240027 RepID=UPI003D96C039